jgi:hypothetical protein
VDPQTALDRLVQVEAEIARLHARQAELLVAVADPAPRIDEYRILEPRADRGEERLVRIEDAARLLLGPPVDTRAALAAGQISYAHARIVVDAVERLSTRLDPSPRAQVRFIGPCVQLQHRVLPIARRGTLTRTRAAAHRAVDRLDAAGQAARRTAARTRRDVWIGTACDGITPLIAHLDTITARAVLAAVQATADTHEPADPRTAGERRADALTSLILGTGSPVAVTADVQVTIPVDQLTGRGTGLELHGLSCLLADPAIACTLRPVLTATSPDGTSGHVLDVGRRTYTLPTALRRLIVTRDRTCRFPGCGRQATHCEIDHAQPWDDGGPTDAHNLGALCTRHHQLKTLGGWQITDSQPDGSCTWTSPLGRTYDHDPPPD